jgi:hypothetical protein
MLMISYGMAFDNSPFGKVANSAPNILSLMRNNTDMIKMCMILQCLDSEALDHLNPPSSILSHQSKTHLRNISKADLSTYISFGVESLEHLPFYYRQSQSPNEALLSIYRVFFYHKVYRGPSYSPDHLLYSYREHGLISYQSELFSVINNAIIL